MFKLLFDPGEFTCFADSAKGTQVLPVTSYSPKLHSFFSINPLDGTRDRNPTADYHRIDRPRRADSNVIAYRNILIEMDKIPLVDQLQLAEASALPFTSCVYSGGKSYHFILSLDTPLADRKAYDLLVKRIYNALGDQVDTACKNPSRLSRAPGHLRRETFKFQDLRELRERITLRELERWLESKGQGQVISEAKERPLTPVLKPSEAHYLFRSSDAFLLHGAPDGEWNNCLFKAACDAFSKGWSLEIFVEKASRITGHLDQKDKSTIMSAFQRVLPRSS